MSKQGIGYRDVLELVELIKASVHFSEIRLRQGDLEIELRRHRPGNGSTPRAVDGDGAAAPAGAGSGASAAPAGAATRSAAAPSPPLVREPTSAIAGAAIVRAPMVGTAYCAPEPGARPYVEIGQAVGADDQVCIVEVMKLMNSIVAGIDGVVAEILFDDGAVVAVGQPLIVIAPRPAR